jgi:hypothetical protein
MYRQNPSTGVVCGRLCPERGYACVLIPPPAENGSQRLCTGEAVLLAGAYCALLRVVHTHPPPTDKPIPLRLRTVPDLPGAMLERCMSVAEHWFLLRLVLL